MEKYGVVTNDELTKTGAAGEKTCPECGSELISSQPRICPKCGSKPMEKENDKGE
jgi:hypothetical protein